MKHAKILVTLLLCLSLAGAAACIPDGSSGEGEDASRQLVEVVRGNLTISVSGSGFIVTPDEVVLTFDNGGKIGRVYVESGDEVNRGQPLVTLYPLDEGALILAVTQAEAALLQAQYELEQTVNPYTEDEIADAEQAVDDAEDWLELTEDMLRYVMKHGSEWEVMQWQMEVFKAETQLTLAEDTLEEMQEEPDEDLVAIMEKQVQAAEQALDETKGALEIEVMNAPFDGAVSGVYVEEGDVIPPASVSAMSVVRLLDTDTMELVIELDEIDIPVVETGQRAIVSVDALPSLQLEGTVTSVSSVPIIEAGVVLYNVRISFDVPEGTKIKVGMSATADTISTERSDVLLVPDRAISYNEGGPVVYVMVDDQIEERPVVVGISDGFQTEIKEGLAEGEIVVVSVKSSSESEGFGLFG
ncbi:MAG: efflux RND transporter periplasmic adaptor subunit [Dehalococcoidales bacterium]|nr:efflux RND transporter periplasmic adaptor subunit [Dehalococcoidales bacterium]